jgi:hypothetical protein
MALPKLNDNPIYDVIIPSSGQVIKFRPFLVKEQKVLLIAFESQDENQLINAMLNTVDSCCKNLDSSKLTRVDVDYVFTMIRSKSVGENVTLIGPCESCGEEMTFEFNLNDLKLPEFKSRQQTIELADDLKVVMKVPTYGDILSNNTFQTNTSAQEALQRMILSCMESVQTKEENILLKDEPLEEKINFIDYLTMDQYEKVTSFISNMPGIIFDVEADCQKCGTKNKKTMEGINNFF